MSISVMQRVEYKYLLSAEGFAALAPSLLPRLTPDKYGATTIQSLYFDTDGYRLITRSLERPEYKEKLRLRAYGVAKATDTVFLEMKRKADGVVYKRRISLPYGEVGAFLAAPNESGQIERELAYFLAFYRPISPKILVLYDREAYFGEDGLRVTFDKNIRYRTDNLDLSSPTDGTPLFTDGRVLMEIKASGGIPLYLAHLLTELQIYKTSFSKVGEVYTRLFSIGAQTKGFSYV